MCTCICVHMYMCTTLLNHISCRRSTKRTSCLIHMCCSSLLHTYEGVGAHLHAQQRRDASIRGVRDWSDWSSWLIHTCTGVGERTPNSWLFRMRSSWLIHTWSSWLIICEFVTHSYICRSWHGPGSKQSSCVYIISRHYRSLTL